MMTCMPPKTLMGLFTLMTIMSPTMGRELQGYTPGYQRPNPYPYPWGYIPLYPGVGVFPMGTGVLDPWWVYPRVWLLPLSVSQKPDLLYSHEPLFKKLSLPSSCWNCCVAISAGAGGGTGTGAGVGAGCIIDIIAVMLVLSIIVSLWHIPH